MAKTIKKQEEVTDSPIFGKTRKVTHMKKDPNAPKKAKSAYLVFSATVSKEIKKENPSITPTEVMKEVANRWKNVVDKSKYEKEAAADKERYLEEMENYSPPPKTPNAAGAASAKKTKAKKDPNAPKKARSAYIIFSMEEGKKARAEDPFLSATDVMKLMGQRWAACDNKATYEAMAAADKERYVKEMSTYQG
jgi:hypothetical protein